MSTIQTVRINDCSHAGNYLSALIHDFRQASGYYVVHANCRTKVHILIEISSINKGGDDEEAVATIYSYDENTAENVRRIILGRFSSPNSVSVSAQPRIERERREAHWREQECNFLNFMHQFEGVDFT